MNTLVSVTQVVGITAMACGMIAVGSCNGDVTSTILQTIMEKNDTELKDSYAHWLPLGLGLNHLGKNRPPQPSESLTVVTSTRLRIIFLSVSSLQVRERPLRRPWQLYKLYLSLSAALPTHWWISVRTPVSRKAGKKNQTAAL